MVGVTAPAGYGKSTLLAQWAEAEDRRVGWVSLDRLDDDPAALLSVLAAAYGRISRPHRSDRRRARCWGINIGPGRATPGVGVPDESGSVRADAGRPARAPVPGLSRCAERGDLGDTARVAAGRGESFRAAPPAAVAGFGRRAGVRRPATWPWTRAGRSRSSPRPMWTSLHELAAAVTARTEGWPAGLYLAAVIASDSHGEVLTISGEDRYVADYLYRESLMQLPDRCPAVPAAHGGPRPAVCSAVRRDSRRVRCASAASAPGGDEPVPGAAGPPAWVVSLPRAVPGVPAR